MTNLLLAAGLAWLVAGFVFAGEIMRRPGAAPATVPRQAAALLAGGPAVWAVAVIVLCAAFIRAVRDAYTTGGSRGGYHAGEDKTG